MGMKFKVSDYDIQAVVDGQLGQEELKMVNQEIQRDVNLKRRYEELMFQKKLLQQWWESEQEDKAVMRDCQRLESEGGHDPSWKYFRAF